MFLQVPNVNFLILNLKYYSNYSTVFIYIKKLPKNSHGTTKKDNKDLAKIQFTIQNVY